MSACGNYLCANGCQGRCIAAAQRFLGDPRESFIGQAQQPKLFWLPGWKPRYRVKARSRAIPAPPPEPCEATSPTQAASAADRVQPALPSVETGQTLPQDPLA